MGSGESSEEAPEAGCATSPAPGMGPAASPGPSPTTEGGDSARRGPTPRSGSRLKNWDYRAFLLESKGSVFDSYRKLGDLGEGAFGDVWLARERVRASTDEESEGRKVAIKRVRKPNAEAGLDEEGADSEEAIVDFRTEVDLMKALDHPSICRLLNVFEDAKNIFLVMEHIKGGELFERLMAYGNFSEHDAMTVIRQIASALAYCHEHGVVHRDIKPENVLVVDSDPGDDDGLDAGEGAALKDITIKLIDFGFGCRILRGAKLRARVGTFLYTAPEALKGEPCDEKVDEWALGCMLFAMLSGSSPFFGNDTKDRIIRGAYSFEAPEWSTISDNAKDLVQRLLVVDPAQRISAADMLHTHPWFAVGTPASMLTRSSLENAIGSIKSFHEQNSLRHLCTGVLARQLDESRLHELHETFTQLDADENGILSVAELKKVCEDFGLNEPEEFQVLFADVDMNGSGEIDYTEFIAACIDKRIKQQEDSCWAAFRVFDLDGNGRITHKELHSVVKSADMNGAFSPDTLEQIWRELTGEALGDSPQDHLDGQVDFDRFLAALGSVETARIRAAMPTDASTSKVQSASASRGLPIAGRRGVSVSGSSLPIASKAALPIDKKAVPVAPGALPIVGRGGGYPSDASGGLPIASRHG